MSSPPRAGGLDDPTPRDDFGCGNEVLDRYFKTQITQDIRRRITSGFVAVDAASGKVAGYFTLAATSIPLRALAEEISRKLPRYPVVPAVRLGRLAVDRQFHGQGLGGALLADALVRCAGSDISAYALTVDANPTSPSWPYI